MSEKKHDEQRSNQPPVERSDEELHQPTWIQKYLDLADLLMRRRRRTDDDHKAA